MKNYPYDMTEFNALVNMCVIAGWDFKVRDIYEGRQIILYKSESDPYVQEREVLNDAVIHENSYGHEKGLLETWDETEDDDVEGYLTAQQVFKIWQRKVK